MSFCKVIPSYGFSVLIKFSHFKKGIFFGLPVGIAVAVSSIRYTGSVVRGVTTGFAVALMGGIIQGWIEEKAEQRRQKRGITLANAPVRTKLILELKISPESSMALCREALRSIDLRIKRIEVDDPLRVVAITKLSFYSFSERITVQAKADGQGLCTLEITSIPRVDTTVVDGGTNYTNVYLLCKFIKDRLDSESFTKETLIDLDKNRPSTLN